MDKNKKKQSTPLNPCPAASRGEMVALVLGIGSPLLASGHGSNGSYRFFFGVHFFKYDNINNINNYKLKKKKANKMIAMSLCKKKEHNHGVEAIARRLAHDSHTNHSFLALETLFYILTHFFYFYNN